MQQFSHFSDRRSPGTNYLNNFLELKHQQQDLILNRYLKKYAYIITEKYAYIMHISFSLPQNKDNNRNEH